MHCTTILPSVTTYYGPMELCGNLTRLVQFLFLGNVKIGSVSKGINIYYIKILSVEKHVFTNLKQFPSFKNSSRTYVSHVPSKSGRR